MRAGHFDKVALSFIVDFLTSNASYYGTDSRRQGRSNFLYCILSFQEVFYVSNFNQDCRFSLSWYTILSTKWFIEEMPYGKREVFRACLKPWLIRIPLIAGYRKSVSKCGADSSEGSAPRVLHLVMGVLNHLPLQFFPMYPVGHTHL